MTQDALQLHRSLLTIDTHIDIPFPDGPNFFDETRRNVDLPKMKRGHMAAGCFAAYVGQGARTPEANAAAVTRQVTLDGFLRLIHAIKKWINNLFRGKTI